MTLTAKVGVDERFNTRQIHVLLVDDHRMVRAGLRRLLEEEGDICVDAEAEDGRAAVEQVDTESFDVVVMDVVMPSLNGVEAAKQIRAKFPEMGLVIVTAIVDHRYVRELLKAGARGYVTKTADPEELRRAVRTIADGGTYLCPEIADHLVAATVPDGTTVASMPQEARLGRREQEVLQLIAEGRSSRQIARLLYISEKTVEAHRRNIMRKLDLHCIAALTRYAIAQGITPLEG